MFLQHEHEHSSQQLIYVWNKFLIKNYSKIPRSWWAAKQEIIYLIGVSTEIDPLQWLYIKLQEHFTPTLAQNTLYSLINVSDLLVVKSGPGVAPQPHVSTHCDTNTQQQHAVVGGSQRKQGHLVRNTSRWARLKPDPLLFLTFGVLYLMHCFFYLQMFEF